MAVTMFHGTSSPTLPIHEGLCLTGSEDRAKEYALAAYGTHVVHGVTIDLDGLTVVEADGEWDRDEATAASDSGGGYGADVIVYDAESPYQRRHVTYRLMTPAALAAVTTAGTRDASEV